MIRSIARQPDGTPLVLLGLTAESVEKLVRDGQPIVVNLSRLVSDQAVPLPDVSVAVFYATEEAVEIMRQTYATTTQGADDDHHNKPARRRFGRRVR